MHLCQVPSQICAMYDDTGFATDKALSSVNISKPHGRWNFHRRMRGKELLSISELNKLGLETRPKQRIYRRGIGAIFRSAYQ